MPPSLKPEVANIGRIGDARLDLVPALADCDPGLKPTEYNVIVAPAAAAKTLGKLSLLIAPDETRDSAAMAMQVGRIVSVSPIAFNYDNWERGEPPQAGDMVWFARYAGALFTGRDDKEYRIIKDKDISAVIEEPKDSKVEYMSYDDQLTAEGRMASARMAKATG